MTPLKRNINRVVVFTLVMLLGSGISGLIYYFKIKSNEASFNVLQLRELERVESSLNTSFEKLKSVTQYFQNASDCKLAPPLGIETEKSEDKCAELIESRLNQIRQSPELSSISLDSVKYELIKNTENNNSFEVEMDQQVKIISRAVQQTRPVILKPGELRYLTLTFTSNSAVLLSSQVSRFPMIMIADKEGKILAQRRYVNADTSTFEAQFETIESINKQKNSEFSGSQIRDLSINDTDVRLYVKPVNGKSFKIDGDNFYLIGVIPKKEINLAKLEVSPKVLMWLIIFLILIIACTPLLKLRFVNNNKAFTKGDVSQICLGSILSLGILSIAINQHLFFDYLEDFKRQQAHTIFSNIKSDFHHEVSALRKQIIKVANDQKELGIKACPKQSESDYYHNTVAANKLVFPYSRKRTGIIEQVAIVNDNGIISNEYCLTYLSNNIFISGELDLSHRQYVKTARDNNYWKLKEDSPFFIERINNIEDGRKNSMFSIPFEKQKFIIAGTRISSLVDRILPKGFGFAVIDESGQVQFHSDEQLSLIENFIIETGNNPELKIANKEVINSSSQISMDLQYKGNKHLVVVGRLSASDDIDNAQLIPWRLVVFYTPYALSFNNMLLVFMGIILLIVVLVPSFVLMRSLNQKTFWTECLYFKETKAFRYGIWSCFIIAISIFLLLSVGLVTELSLRLLFWLTACLGLVSFLHRRMRVDLRPYSRITYPQSVIIIIILVAFIIHFTSSQSISLPYIPSNILAFIVGSLCLLVSYWMVKKRWKSDKTLVPSDCSVRPKSHVDEKRFTRTYIIYLSALVFLVGAVPGYIISNSTNAYLLQRQADLQSQHLYQAKLVKEDEIESFASLFMNKGESSSKDDETAPLKKWKDSKIDLKSLSPCLFPKNVVIDDRGDTSGSCSDDSETISSNLPNVSWIATSLSAFPSLAEKERINLIDRLIDSIFKSVSFQSEYGTQLSYLAKTQQDIINKDSPRLIYRPDQLMLAAFFNNSGFVILATMLMLSLLFYSMKHLIAQRLLGEHIPEHFRVIRPCDRQHGREMEYSTLSKLVHKEDVKGVQLLNANVSRAIKVLQEKSIKLFAEKAHHIQDCVETSNQLFLFEEELKGHLSQIDDKENLIVAFYGLEQLSTDIRQSTQALALLNNLFANKRIKLIIIADTSPLFRLLNADHYAKQNEKFEKPSIDLITGWTRLFAEFHKEYLWLPTSKSRLSDTINIEKLIEYETKAWHPLKQVKEKFFEYHYRIKNGSSSLPSPIDNEDYFTYHERVKEEPAYKGLEHFWSPEQVIEFFLVQAGPIYRRHWELCTREEKFALWQMANGANINPSNAGVLEHLVRRGYIYRDKGWNIINESFKRFVLSAESEKTISEWLEHANRGIWPIMRIPIFTIFIVLVVVLYYSSGDSLTSFISIATATLGLIPLVLKNVNLVKGETLPETD